MSSSSKATLNILHGALINPESLTTYALLPRALIAVDPNGNIAWIEEDVYHSDIQKAIGRNIAQLRASSSNADILLTELEDGEFILPGFIDTHTVSQTPCSSSLPSLISVSLACPASSQHGKVRSMIIILLSPLG